MKKELKNIFNSYKIPNSDLILDNFETFHDMMIDYNSKHNLTSITEIPEALYKHYLDSILPFELFKDNSTVIDLGCGGGFPSIPLKIINNSLKFTAVDSVNKKTEFVNMVKNRLNFDNFTVIHSRIEELAFKKEYREQYDYVISRAVAPLNIILEYSAPFTKNNGHIICYKGSKYKEEIETAQNALKLLNCKVIDIKEYYIEEIDAFRYIIIIEKMGNISSKYPRKQNKPRLQPL